MNSNRITYQSCLLYSSDENFNKANQNVFEIPRVQSSSLGLSFSLAEDNPIGFGQTDNNFYNSNLSFEFEGLLNDFNIFDKIGVCQKSGWNYYFFQSFSGLNSQRNFYILTVDNGENVSNNRVFSRGDECYVTAITENVVNSLDIDISASELVKYSVSFDGLNASLETGNYLNSSNLSNGNKIYYTLPSGNGELGYLPALSANYITLDFSNNKYENLESSSCGLDNIKISFDIERTNSQNINSITKERNIVFPVKCKVDITAKPKNKQEYDLINLFDSFKKNNLYINLYDHTGSQLPTINLCFENLYLLSSKSSLSINNEPESVDLSFYCNLGPEYIKDNSRFYMGMPYLSRSAPINLSISGGGYYEAGKFIKLSVSAEGSEPLSYQWYFNEEIIDGATDKELIFKLTSGVEGNYFCKVSNSYGSSSTETVSVLIGIKPIITTQPSTETYYENGDNVTLSVEANGIPSISYQWYFNGNIIDGATSSSYDVSVSLTSVGYYYVVVSNTIGSTVSSYVNINIGAAPIITTQPVGGKYELESQIILSVTVYSGPTPSYQWYFIFGSEEAIAVSGATQSSLTVSLEENLVGYYYCVITNDFGYVQTNSVEISKSLDVNGIISNNIDGAYSIADGNDGYLYVTAKDGNGVYKINTSNGENSKIATVEKAKEIILASDGYLYVVSSLYPASPILYKIDKSSGIKTEFVTDIGNIYGIVEGQDGDLYVTSSTKFAIYKINKSTGEKNIIKSSSVGYYFIEGSDGNLYITDLSSNSVYSSNKTSGNYTFISSAIDKPYDIIEASDGYLYVTAKNEDSVYKIDKETKILSKISSDIEDASRIIECSDGYLYVSSSANKIYKINKNTGSSRVFAEGIDGAHGMVEHGGYLYITAIYGDNIFRISLA